MVVLELGLIYSLDAFHPREEGRIGDGGVEGWKDGRMEGWEDGRMEATHRTRKKLQKPHIDQCRAPQLTYGDKKLPSSRSGINSWLVFICIRLNRT